MRSALMSDSAFGIKHHTWLKPESWSSRRFIIQRSLKLSRADMITAQFILYNPLIAERTRPHMHAHACVRTAVRPLILRNNSHNNQPLRLRMNNTLIQDTHWLTECEIRTILNFYSTWCYKSCARSTRLTPIKGQRWSDHIDVSPRALIFRKGSLI